MLTQTGVVTDIQFADQSQPIPQATIQALPASACERCLNGGGCGAGLFSRLLRMPATELVLPAPDELQLGQRVWLAIDERQLVRQAWYWYGLPSVGFLLGAALPQWLWPAVTAAKQPGQDALSILSGVSLMIISWLLARTLQRPQMPRILLNSPCTD